MGVSEVEEILADVQHEIWAHWMDYLFSQCKEAEDGWVIPLDKVWRWSRQIITPYSELSEREKDSDRDQAKKIIDALVIGGFSVV